MSKSPPASKADPLRLRAELKGMTSYPGLMRILLQMDLNQSNPPGTQKFDAFGLEMLKLVEKP